MICYAIGKDDVSFSIPDGVMLIDDFAFEDCKSIKKVCIPASVTNIGDQVFSGCSNITEFWVDERNQSYCTIDGNLYTKDGKELVCYAQGKNDTSVTIPYGVTYIHNVVFDNCKKLTNVTIPDSVTRIEAAAFKGCSNLKSITIPRGIKELDRSVFEGCTALEELSLQNGISIIGDCVFAGCTSLRDIEIPDSVEYISYDAFYGCESLTIHAPKGSYAEEYAKENDIPFKSIE